nr:immunoglobulin heavy chain junction region [Macaca mulatta]
CASGRRQLDFYYW